MYAITTINVSFSTAFTESNKFCYFVFSFTFHLQCMTFLYLHSLIPFSFPSYFKWVYYMLLGLLKASQLMLKEAYTNERVFKQERVSLLVI